MNKHEVICSPAPFFLSKQITMEKLELWTTSMNFGWLPLILSHSHFTCIYIYISVFVAHTYQHVSENQLTTTRFFKNSDLRTHKWPFFLRGLKTCFSIWGIISGRIWKKLGDFFSVGQLVGVIFFWFFGSQEKRKMGREVPWGLREDRFQPILLLVQWKNGCISNHGPPKPIFLEVFYGK